jgi:rare lipoprotein A
MTFAYKSDAPLWSAESPRQRMRAARRWLMWAAVPLLSGCAGLPFLAGKNLPGKTDPQTAVVVRPAEPVVETAHVVTAPPAPPVAAPAPPPRVAIAPPLRPPPIPPDAVPRVEPIPQREPNRPYVVRGGAYKPLAVDVPMRETGVASWYGEPFHGRRTANGEVYDMNTMTAAHKTMPLPSYAVVRNLKNGKQVVVRVNDRGPFKDERIIDLSHAAARKLGFTGLVDVEVRRLTHREIRTGSWKLPAQTLASASP